MDSRERSITEQRTQLTHQHDAEWHAQLVQETRDRIALEEQFKQDQSDQDEINVYDRALLVAQQQQSLNDLVRQNRITRIAMLKRHTRENEVLK
jgi:hypothetical protein